MLVNTVENIVPQIKEVMETMRNSDYLRFIDDATQLLLESSGWQPDRILSSNNTNGNFVIFQQMNEKWMFCFDITIFELKRQIVITTSHRVIFIHEIKDYVPLFKLITLAEFEDYLNTSNFPSIDYDPAAASDETFALTL
jgi:hypothetical protein